MAGTRKSAQTPKSGSEAVIVSDPGSSAPLESATVTDPLSTSPASLTVVPEVGEDGSLRVTVASPSPEGEPVVVEVTRTMEAKFLPEKFNEDQRAGADRPQADTFEARF